MQMYQPELETVDTLLDRVDELENDRGILNEGHRIHRLYEIRNRMILAKLNLQERDEYEIANELMVPQAQLNYQISNSQRILYYSPEQLEQIRKGFIEISENIVDLLLHGYTLNDLDLKKAIQEFMVYRDELWYFLYKEDRTTVEYFDGIITFFKAFCKTFPNLYEYTFFELASETSIEVIELWEEFMDRGILGGSALSKATKALQISANELIKYVPIEIFNCMVGVCCILSSLRPGLIYEYFAEDLDEESFKGLLFAHVQAQACAYDDYIEKVRV